MAGGHVLALLAIAAFAFTIIHFFRTWARLRHIPGPFWASITNLQRVYWTKTGHAELYHQAVHAKYGDVVRIGPQMVSFSNPEAIPTVYPIRPGFPKGDFYATLRPYSQDRGAMRLVFNTQDEKLHKTLKSPIAPLFSLSNVVHFEGLVDKVLTCLSEQFDRRFVATGKTADLCEWSQYFAFDVMGSMSFSKRYGFLEQGTDVGGMAEAIFQFFKAAAPMTQMTWLDPLLYKNSIVHRFRRTPGMTILKFVVQAIQERVSEPEKPRTESDSESGDKDFLSRFLEIHQAHPELPPWASTAWTFSNVIAGSDSTGAIMRTVLYHLLANPKTLETLNQELDSANLSHPYPRWEEVRDLPYLDACVQEAIRIHPPFSLPFERQVPAGGVEVLGHHIPEGVLIGGNAYVVNRHEPTFGAGVEEWRPERWLGDAAHKKKLEQSILTFGAGRRICLGKHIGIFEIKKLVPFLLQNYRMKMIDPKALTTESGFLFKQKGCHCKIERREVKA